MGWDGIGSQGSYYGLVASSGTPPRVVAIGGSDKKAQIRRRHTPCFVPVSYMQCTFLQWIVLGGGR